MLVDFTPLFRNRNFALLYFGQWISFLGSMVTYVAVPYQLYQLTRSSFLVGLLGAAQLAPLAVTSLYGGALADALNRRRVLLWSEAALTIVSLGFLANSLLDEPSVPLIFVLAAAASALSGFHRPAMEALTPQIVDKKDYASVASLNSVRFSIGAIVGPMAGGVLISQFGPKLAYALDALTFVLCIGALLLMAKIPDHPAKGRASLAGILEGLRYASTRQELIASYLVDIVAMVFAMPMALFPSMAEDLGGAKAAGWLFAAMPLGSLFVALFSGAANRVRRHGAAIVLAATLWGAAIVGLSFADTLAWTVFALALSGGFDAVSAIFRQTLWNQTIPATFRGRLAGVEMLSFMSGPLLGNARAGMIASVGGNFVSVFSGGALCVLGCLACIPLFPKFWSYRSSTDADRAPGAP